MKILFREVDSCILHGYTKNTLSKHSLTAFKCFIFKVRAKMMQIEFQ